MTNNIFIISGPSGAGEDSVISGIKKELEVEKLLTTTTREMREGEINGKDYYFISKEEFKDRLDEGDFFEWAEQDNGNLYGVTYAEIERVKKLNKAIVWKIDYKGIINAKKLMPEIIVIFIDAPLNQIEDRIRKRSNVTEEFVQGRLEYAKGWYNIKNLYDYEVSNENGRLGEAIQKVKNIIVSELKKDTK